MRCFSRSSKGFRNSKGATLFGGTRAIEPTWHRPQRPISRDFGRLIIHAGSEALFVEYCGKQNWKSELPRFGISQAQGAAVALGKFDAMHTGHRSLAAEATKLGGQPWLLSFSGMAEVLGWPERPPLVADCDRPRVLTSWAPHCGGIVPCQRFIPFSEVRQLSPEDFIQALALDLKVSGIVVGKGFRFGYKAAGNTEALRTLGARFGLKVSIVDLVEGDATHGSEKVSSSSVRSALADGQVERVRDLLGRRHRLVIQPANWSAAASPPERCTFLREDFQNQPPGDGEYSADVTFIGDEAHSIFSSCQVTVDNHGIVIQTDCTQAGIYLNDLAQVHVDF